MNIITMLDQLADFQAQADYLEIKKRELLDAVKVPDEVLAAQDEANKRRQALDSEYWKRQNAVSQMKQRALDAVPDPEMPPEYVAALEAAHKRRIEIEEQFALEAERERGALLTAKAKIDADLQAQIREVYAQVETRKGEINAEFAGKAEAVQDNIAKLTAEIKSAVIDLGKTVKGTIYQAVYQKGRVTWSTDILDGVYFALNRALEKLNSFVSIQDELSGVRADIKDAVVSLGNARKEGAPSVSFRKVG